MNESYLKQRTKKLVETGIKFIDKCDCIDDCKEARKLFEFLHGTFLMTEAAFKELQIRLNNKEQQCSTKC